MALKVIFLWTLTRFSAFVLTALFPALCTHKRHQREKVRKSKTTPPLPPGGFLLANGQPAGAVARGIDSARRPWPRAAGVVGGRQWAFTSFLVNFGEWSFLSSIMMVAVAVPVNPTSSPAMSWASMISSYLGFSRVYKAKTRQTRRHLGLGCHLGLGGRGGYATPSPIKAGIPHPQSLHLFCVTVPLASLQHETVMIHTVVGTESVFCPCWKGHSVHSRLSRFRALGRQTMHVWRLHPFMSFHSDLTKLYDGGQVWRWDGDKGGSSGNSPLLSNQLTRHGGLDFVLHLFSKCVKAYIGFSFYRWKKSQLRFGVACTAFLACHL